MHVILLVQQESLAIDKLEQELNNCKVDYGDNASTADMNNATYDAIDCVVGVAHKIFDTYYSSTAKESKEQFDKLRQSLRRPTEEPRKSRGFKL